MKSRVSVGVMLVLLGVVSVLFVAGALVPWYYSRPRAIPDAPATAVPELTAAPFGSTAPVVHPSAHRTPSGTPLAGAVFAPSDEVREMRLDGVPITFVTPRSWGCLSATVDIRATAWRCIDEQAGSGRPQVDIIVRQCAAACTAAERAEVDGELTVAPAYTVRDPATGIAERTADGKYTLTLNRVFSTSWVLVVQAEARSQPGDKAVVQKIVNDMYVQTA
jgi:hypothetical protein